MEKFYNGVNRKNTNCIKWDLVEDCENDILPFSIADSDYPTCDSVLEALEKRIKEVMKENNFIRTGSSPDMYENDTGLYHKTLEFAKERMEI